MTMQLLPFTNKKQKRGSAGTLADPYNHAEAFADEAEAVSLAPVDEAVARTQPANVDRFHHEYEYDHKANEQEHSWSAAGERTARNPAVEAAGLEHQAEDLKHITDGQVGLVAQSRERLALARRVFWAHTRRERGDKLMYYARMVALLVGDIVGVAGAAILLGELVALALLQGLSSGAAAITAGVIGADVKDIVRMRARRKSPDELTDDEQKVAHHFSGAHEGEKIVKALVGTMLLVTLLITGSILALRSPTQGTTAALAFALLAAAVSLASFLNSYSYSDEIASLLSTVENTYKRDLKMLMKKLIPHPIRREHAEANVAATSIRLEHENQGAAAVSATHAHSHAIKRRHPGVAGHGTAVRPSDERPSDIRTTDERNIPLDDIVPYELDAAGSDGSNNHGRSEA
jgi:hypothetical protein